MNPVLLVVGKDKLGMDRVFAAETADAQAANISNTPRIEIRPLFLMESPCFVLDIG